MAITIPNVDLIRPTTTPTMRIPNAMKTATVNPCPVQVAASGTASSGTILVEPTIDSTGKKYLGYNISSNNPTGVSPDDAQMGVVRGCVVDGFAGVTPGSLVFVDATTRPDPETTFSGLTHTVPTIATPATAAALPVGPMPVGMGVTTTKIFFFS